MISKGKVVVKGGSASTSRYYNNITNNSPRINHLYYNEYLYPEDDVHPIRMENDKYADRRRGISSQSPYWGVFGIPRENFDRRAIDIIRVNPYYLLMETALCNYLRGISFDVKDKEGHRVESAYKFLANPNPQQGFWDVFISMVRDLIAYDAGVIVKTYSRGGYCVELHAYSGPDFWGQIDRKEVDDMPNNNNALGKAYVSHGYVTRWWQRLNNGYTYQHYLPEEVCYFKQYPRSQSIYGDAILMSFKYHFRYLISSTVAAGRMMDNGLMPNLVWTHPDIASIEVLQQRLDSADHVNVGADNFGKTLHLLGNETVSTVDNTLADAKWLEGQQFVFKIILNIFGFPASEFSMEDVSTGRAASVVSRNIMKSRMLSTILSNIEDKINREILPELRGYTSDWYFQFDKFVELDDKLKQSRNLIDKCTAANLLTSMGMPLNIALRVAQIGDDLSPEDNAVIDELIQQGTNNAVDTQMGRYGGQDFEETTIIGGNDRSSDESIRYAQTGATSEVFES